MRPPLPLLAVLALLLAAAPAPAQEAPPEFRDRTLVIGTRQVPPFAMKGEDGSWHGLSIDLWEAVGEDLGLRWEYREGGLRETLDGVRDGSLDAAVAAFTITAERERTLDFSTPFHVSGLGIATVPGAKRSIWDSVQDVVSGGLLRAVGGLALLLFVVGFLVWLFERRRNPEQFGGGAAKGLGSAFWWSAVTMTTVGYGDRAPRTLGGRLVAIVWMFAAILLISGFTAAIATGLTVGRLEPKVTGPDDLGRVRVGSVDGSTGSSYLADRGIRHRRFESAAAALDALAQGAVDAVVYDAPILRYLANTEYADRVTVLPGTFRLQNYAIVLPQGSALRESLNVSLTRLLESPERAEIVRRYLGDG